MGFEIGEPVKEVPRGNGGRSSKYRAIWERVTAMTNGDALPVTFESPKQAQCFQSGSVKRAKAEGLRVHSRRNVVYISRVHSD